MKIPHHGPRRGMSQSGARRCDTGGFAACPEIIGAQSNLTPTNVIPFLERTRVPGRLLVKLWISIEKF